MARKGRRSQRSISSNKMVLSSEWAHPILLCVTEKIVSYCKRFIFFSSCSFPLFWTGGRACGASPCWTGFLAVACA